MPVDEPFSTKQCCLTTKTASPYSISSSLIKESDEVKVHEESNIGVLYGGLGPMKTPGLKAVSDGTGEGAPMLAADIAMSAADVGETIREVRASTSEGRTKQTVLEEAGSAKKLRFQHLMWSRAEAGVMLAATYTEVAAPVPV